MRGSRSYYDPRLSEETTQRGELFILSAPSGTGKTTLIRGMMQELGRFGDIVFSVSHTTRPPRAGEVPGRDYHFVSRETFQEMIEEDQFLEWATVHKHLYGTSKAEVHRRLEEGVDVILDIDVQGAERVMASHPEAHSIFIMPPSFGDLERRLRGRGLDDPEQIGTRLAVSLQEMACYDRYRYVIVNDDARRASDVLASIILEKRHRLERMRGRVQSILRDFRDIRDV